MLVTSGSEGFVSGDSNSREESSLRGEGFGHEPMKEALASAETSAEFIESIASRPCDA